MAAHAAEAGAGVVFTTDPTDLRRLLADVPRIAVEKPLVGDLMRPAAAAAIVPGTVDAGPRSRRCPEPLTDGNGAQNR